MFSPGKSTFSPRRTATALLAAVVVAAMSACASTAPKSSSGSSGSTGTAAGSGKTFVVGYSQSNNAEPYRAQLNLQLAYYVKKYPDL